MNHNSCTHCSDPPIDALRNEDVGAGRGNPVAEDPLAAHARTLGGASNQQAAASDPCDAAPPVETVTWAQGSPLDPYLRATDGDRIWEEETAVSGTAVSRPGHSRAAAPRPDPLPTRPKGRLLVGAVVLTLCGAAFYSVWNAFFRYQAYGIVAGRRIQVSAPWQAFVRAFHVHEGDTVHQGQLLATVDSAALLDRRAEVTDQLRLAQAELDAELSRLAWQTQARGDQAQKAVAEYYQLWGTLLQEQARLQDLQSQQLRVSQLYQQKVATQEQWDSVRFATDGQQARVEKLRTAVDEMKRRAAAQRGGPDMTAAQLKPRLMRIKILQDELCRLGREIKRGEIRAPVDGRVMRRERFVGEYTDPTRPLLTILEEGSLEVVLYVPQRRADLLRAGDTTSLQVPPHRDAVPCRVLRIGDQLQPAPESVQRFYHCDERLVPVHLEPDQGAVARGILRLDSTVRLPAGWSEAIARLLN